MDKQNRLIESYELMVNNIVVEIEISFNEMEGTTLYAISLTNISETTKLILDKIREEFIDEETKNLAITNEGMIVSDIQSQFKTKVLSLIRKYFPNADRNTSDMLMNYVIQQNIGLGNVEILLKDINLEEIVINNSKEPVWVYHRRHGWMRTNIIIPTEQRIRHFATIIARDANKEITNLTPLLDARLSSGDRINATLNPISSKGNTITIRKFSTKPWTITDLIKGNAISYDGAALIWLAIQYEQSVILSGGTASGKTSMLNAVANFFPPNQRIISIEDTRELQLPVELHWVPMETRLPNPEGKGGVTMLDLIVNSLRMRPDRIVVGEIRRKEEAEVLFEAMHTGHSVYGTLHANNAYETITRLTNPPIELPRSVLSSLGMIITQHLNRRTGKRQTLQIAEVTPEGTAKVLMQHNQETDKLETLNEPKVLFDTLNLYSGMSADKIKKDLEEKKKVLQWMVKNNINDVNKVGTLMSNYYYFNKNIATGVSK